MRLGKDLTGKPIISMTDGRLLGTVKDLYVNPDLYWLTGIYAGHEGLIKRKSLVIDRENVAVFGIDAILVKNSEVVTDDKEHPEVENWLRLDKLRGREVDTPGGTKVGTVGDIVLGEEGHVTGFTLSRVFVEGPIAEKGTIPREALIDTGDEDKVMTIDLPKVEQLYKGQTGETE
ncbi:MAG TPA: PRC-barrel domain-containing protein [Anaerolineae bacterium]